MDKKEKKKEKTPIVIGEPLNKIFGIFYSPEKIISYGRVLNFSVGSRSIGKSTGWAILLLYEYLKNGKQWIYVRRTDDELQLTAKSWFDNAQGILRQHGYQFDDIIYKGGAYMMGDEICGYAVPLSLEHKYKSTNFSKVKWIVYDEFLPRNGMLYLGGRGSMVEVESMVSLYQTVDRGIGSAFRNETRIVFMGNAYSFYNPFFINYGIDKYLRADTKYLAPKDAMYVVEMTRETEATKQIKESNGFKISTAKTKTEAYANEMSGTKSPFIKRYNGVKKSLFNVRYEGQTYGIYYLPGDGHIYVSSHSGTAPVTIAATCEDHTPDYYMIQRWSGFQGTIVLRQAFEMGRVMFENGRCQNFLVNYMMYSY